MEHLVLVWLLSVKVVVQNGRYGVSREINKELTSIVLPSFKYLTLIQIFLFKNEWDTWNMQNVNQSSQLQKRNLLISLEFLFCFPFSWVVHAKEGWRFPVNISLPLNKGWEGRDTVADEVIGLAEDIQVDLSSVRLQAHDLHLHKMCQHYYILFPKSRSHIRNVKM